MSDVVASARRLRGSSTHNPLGALTDYRRDPLSLFYREAVKHRGSVRIRLVHRHIHLLVEPEHIRHVLAVNTGNYTKGINYGSLRLFLSRFDVELVSGMHVGENPQIVNTPDPVMVRIHHRSGAK